MSGTRLKDKPHGLQPAEAAAVCSNPFPVLIRASPPPHVKTSSFPLTDLLEGWARVGGPGVCMWALGVCLLWAGVPVGSEGDRGRESLELHGPPLPAPCA